MMKRVGIVSLAIGLAVATFSSGALAQPAAQPPGEQPLPGDRAVALAKEGLAAYEAGKWVEAYDKFRAADELAHSTAFRLYMARALANQNKLIDARAIYRNIAAEKLAEDAAPSWRRAQADARAELTALEPKIPSVIVTVVGASPTAKIELDGAPCEVGKSIEVDPGEHRVAVTDGDKKKEELAEIRAGEHDHAIVVKFNANDGKPPPAGPTPTKGSLAPGIALLAVGGASLITGAILGGVALAKNGSLNEDCPSGVCGSGISRDDFVSRKDEMFAIAHASTTTLSVGAAVAAVGVVLVIVRPGGDDDTPAVSVSPTGLSLSGKF
ncbi:MAG: hypothetical protein HOW73_50320 [Polyangiaceae bacterium]|nr:hypothetical protein [Polyangiaceae bacterium]